MNVAVNKKKIIKKGKLYSTESQMHQRWKHGSRIFAPVIYIFFYLFSFVTPRFMNGAISREYSRQFPQISRGPRFSYLPCRSERNVYDCRR